MTTNSKKNIINDLNSPNTEEDENKIMCRMINVNLKEFFGDIYIPIKFFREADWKINKVLYDNEDCLFFNDKYLATDDHKRFYEVFDKYITVVEEILSPKNRLSLFLKRWTDISDLKWKANPTKSYLKSLLTSADYQIISPAYTTNIYCELSKKYRDDNEKIKIEIEKHLDNILKKMNYEIDEFEKIYKKIVDSYVYEYPIDNPEMADVYVLGFINSVILATIEFADKLLDLNIYAVHPIILNIIDFYTPLDEINRYDPKEHGNRKLYII